MGTEDAAKLDLKILDFLHGQVLWLIQVCKSVLAWTIAAPQVYRKCGMCVQIRKMDCDISTSH